VEEVLSVAGLEDLPLEIFSGLVTDLAASDLPAGASPACSDCIFILGGVLTRPGLGAGAIAGLPGSPAVNYIKTFTDLQLNQRMLFLDSLGVIRQEFPQGTLTSINPGQNGVAGSYAQSSTLFGREYIAFSDGKFGVDIPRQFDTTNYDRVSQVGPGAAPASAVDVSFALTALSRTSGIISGTTAAAHGLVVGGLVNIAGQSADATFNGQWPVISTPTPTTFTAWGAPSEAAITGMTRAGGVVTAILATTPSFAPGDTIVVGKVIDASFDGKFTAATISGNVVTWPQAGTGATTSGGILYSKSYVAPVNFATNFDSLGLLQILGTFPPPGFQVGGEITVAGNAVGAFNSTFTIASIYEANPNNGVIEHGVFYYIGLSTLPSSSNGSGGTATSGVGDSAPAVTGVAGPAGSITAGVHQVSTLFVTRQGYLTRPAPPNQWIAQGGFTASVTGIPVGLLDSNVVARILCFTTAGGATFFYLTAMDGALEDMIILDNTTAALVVDFDDTVLADGTNVQNLFDLVELGECAGAIAYSSRLFWWGERNKIQNFLNLTFDGGSIAGVAPIAGWTVVANPGGGSAAIVASSIWDGALLIEGNGADAVVGMITQGAANDYLGQAILQQATSYSVRVRVGISSVLAKPNAGTQLIVDLYSPSLATSYGVFAVTAAQVGALTPGTMAEFIGLLTPSPTGIPIIPADLELRVYANGTLAAGAAFIVDNIEPFPTKQPYNITQVRASYAEDPESYDGVTGFLNVAPENGQAVRSAFVLREKLYLVKERSLYATEDDGQNEPNLWPITEISNRVGTESVHGVDVGEEWAIIAARAGVYIFWGPEPVKISQEIQPTWNTINWAAAQTIWVTIDTVNRRILVGAPTNGATQPNIVFMFDYRGLDVASEIADHWTVRYSSYTGKILAIGNAPKWSPWTMQINACALIERLDGTAHTFLGNGKGSGKIYDPLDPQVPGSGGVYNDDGAGIPWTYTTYYAPGHMDEQALKLGSHRKLYGYLTGLVEGSGLMDITAQPIGNITPTKLPSIQLVNVTAPAPVTNAVRTQGTTTITCAAGHNLTAADTQAVLAGMPDPSLDGTFPIMEILNAQQFTIAQLYLPDIAPGPGGTVTRLLRDFEMTTNLFGERLSYTFSNHGNTPNSWFKMEKLVMSMKTDPWSPVRGGN
jgi:hypothetical protein